MLSEIEFRSDRAGWASQVLTGENIKGGGGWAKSGTLLSLGGVGWGGGEKGVLCTAYASKGGGGRFWQGGGGGGGGISTPM